MERRRWLSRLKYICTDNKLKKNSTKKCCRIQSIRLFHNRIYQKCNRLFRCSRICICIYLWKGRYKFCFCFHFFFFVSCLFTYRQMKWTESNWYTDRRQRISGVIERWSTLDGWRVVFGRRPRPAGRNKQLPTCCVTRSFWHSRPSFFLSSCGAQTLDKPNRMCKQTTNGNRKSWFSFLLLFDSAYLNDYSPVVQSPLYGCFFLGISFYFF